MRVLAVLVVLAAGAAAWFFFNPDVTTRLKDVLPDSGLTTKTDTIYKWRNAAGEWQLTDTPPPDGIEYERSDYREDVNVLPVPPGIERE